MGDEKIRGLHSQWYRDREIKEKGEARERQRFVNEKMCVKAQSAIFSVRLKT